MYRPLAIKVQSLWEAHSLISNHGPPIGEIIREIFLETFSCQKIISIWPTLCGRLK